MTSKTPEGERAPEDDCLEPGESRALRAAQAEVAKLRAEVEVYERQLAPLCELYDVIREAAHAAGWKGCTFPPREVLATILAGERRGLFCVECDGGVAVTPAPRCTASAPHRPRRRCAKLSRLGPPNPAGLWRDPLSVRTTAFIESASDSIAAEGGYLDPLYKYHHLGGWSLRNRACRDPRKRGPVCSRGEPRACLVWALDPATVTLGTLGNRIDDVLQGMIDAQRSPASRDEATLRRARDELRAILAVDPAKYTDPDVALVALICTLPARAPLRLERTAYAERLRTHLAHLGWSADEIAQAIDDLVRDEAVAPQGDAGASGPS